MPIRGAPALWKDETGQPWIYVPLWGAPAKSVSETLLANGSAPHDSVFAFKVDLDQTGTPRLRLAWVSPDVDLPDAPVVANGVVFTLATGENPRGTLVAQEFDAASLKLRGEAHLIASPVSPRHQETVATVSSNGLLLYSAAKGPISQLTWFDREGRSARVLGDTGEYVTFRISADTRHIAAVLTPSDGDNELWIVESPRGASVRVGNIANPSLCIWSPDGRAVVYTDLRTHALARQDVSGTGESRQLTQTSPHLQMPSENVYPWPRP